MLTQTFLLGWFLVFNINILNNLLPANISPVSIVGLETEQNGVELLQDSWFWQAEYYFNSGPQADGTYDLKQANYLYRKATTDDDPVHPLAWYQLGRTYFLLGNFQQAEKSFFLHLAIYEDSFPQVHYMLGLVYGYRAKSSKDVADWSKAEYHFLQYINHRPNEPWPYVDYAWTLFAQGKYKTMREALEPIIENFSDNPWVLNMYALALLNTGDKEIAHGYFVAADSAAELLNTEDWGRTYPGNDPAIWGAGLAEFKAVIKKNIELSALNHSTN